VIWGDGIGIYGMELERGVMESVLSWLDDLRDIMNLHEMNLIRM
jgi:hypothetical protein